jgi:hypothetical protein
LKAFAQASDSISDRIQRTNAAIFGERARRAS